MRVGTSKHVCYYQLTTQDHPHACGDKLYKASAEIINPGSSPCVWGQDLLSFFRYIGIRIIPMRVGTSLTATDSADRVRDHPHACGDKLCCLSESRQSPGSSPCVWGQVNDTVQSAVQDRIIPMRVGTRFCV